MSLKAKVDPVTFEDLKTELEVALKMIEEFVNGEYLSKNKSHAKLLSFRNQLSKIKLKIPGARLHTFNVENELVPKAVVESVDAHLPGVEEKVEVPE
jgi:hypothetical protein